MTEYIDLFTITDLQKKTLQVIIDWVKTNKTPIPQTEILTQLKKQGITKPTCISSLTALLKKHYIRRAIIISNKSYYVLLRTR